MVKWQMRIYAIIRVNNVTVNMKSLQMELDKNKILTSTQRGDKGRGISSNVKNGRSKGVNNQKSHVVSDWLLKQLT